VPKNANVLERRLFSAGADGKIKNKSEPAKSLPGATTGEERRKRLHG